MCAFNQRDQTTTAKLDKLVLRLQPPNSGRIDGVTSGDVNLRPAISKALDGFSPLMDSELRGTAEFDTTGFRSLSAVSCAGEDQFAFKFSYEWAASTAFNCRLAAAMHPSCKFPWRANYPFHIRTNFFQPVTYVTGICGPSRVKSSSQRKSPARAGLEAGATNGDRAEHPHASKFAAERVRIWTSD
jgi:hypothetical protein